MLTNRNVLRQQCPPPTHQAGYFALEDLDIGSLVDRIEGLVDSIFGLPVDLLCTLVTRAVV